MLVCEDDELVRLLLETILTENGYRILAASRPEEALELAAAREAQIDALVTDTVMPHMSGQQARSLGNGLSTPEPALSAG